MSLSSSTLNLKFMQRAAVRNAQQSAQSTPTRPVAGSSSTPGASDIKPSPSALRDSISAPTTREATPVVPVLVGLAAEQEAKARWVLPRSTTSGVKTENGERAEVPRPRIAEGRVTFESSYLPFILGDTAEDEAGPSRPGAGRFSGGGGRMAFGGFGEAPKAEEEEAEEEEEGKEKGSRKGKGRLNEDERGGQKRPRGEVFRDKAEMGRSGRIERERAKGDAAFASRSSGKPYEVTRDTKPHNPRPAPHTTAQGFVRPANYTPDLPHPITPPTQLTPLPSQSETKPSVPSPQSISHKRKPSTAADSLRPSSSAADPAPGKTGKKRTKSAASSSGPSSSSTPVKVEGVKRAKLDLSKSSGSTSVVVSPVPVAGSAGADLDARERALKAEKKREKKAKRKLKAEGSEGVII